MFQVLSGTSSVTQHWASARQPSLSSPVHEASDRLDWRLTQIFDVLCIMLLILNGNIPILVPATGTVGSKVNLTEQQSGMFAIIFNAISLSLLLYFAATFYRTKFKIPQRLASARFACLFVLYALCSLFWGVSPLQRTFLACLLLVGTMAYIFYLFEQYSPRQLHLLLVACLSTLAAGSIVIAVALPKYGIDSVANVGAWQGVFGQKNALGIAMVLSLSCILTMRSLRGSRRAALFILSAIPLAFSRSRESWVAAAVCIFAFALIRGIFRFSKSDRVFIVGAGATLLTTVSVLVAVYAREILALMGRDMTFSGRTKIWSVILQLISLRPVVGYGLAGASGTTIWATVEAATGWQFASGSTHSIYLDSLFRFGWLGTAIIVSALVLGATHALKGLSSATSEEIELPILLLLGLLVCGVTGHGLFETPGIQLVLFFLALFQLDRQAHPVNRFRSA